MRVRYDDDAITAQHASGLFWENLARDDEGDLLRNSRRRSGSTETIRAKYMIGCDGAHSWTRRQLEFTMEGEQTDLIWGVLDVVPITDFRAISTTNRYSCGTGS